MERPSDLIQSVSRALRVLEVVGEEPCGLNPKRVAQRCGLHPSTAYHLLRTLAYEGYLVRLPSGDYRSNRAQGALPETADGMPADPNPFDRTDHTKGSAVTGRGRVRVESGPGKRVRAQFAGVMVADTTRALLVWEKPYYPTYYLPAGDVRTDLLVPTGEIDHSPSRGDAERHTLKTGANEAEGAALWYRTSPLEGLADHIRLEWSAMDAWFEEEEQVYVHPRNPYTRVDVLQSSRHVRVEVDGVTVADSHQPRILFETGLPPRYYLPKTDVRMDLLVASDHVTHCPYKGSANYYDLELDDTTYDNAVWWYRHPIAESQQIAGYVCFYNERVDLFVDGVKQERPRTPFS